MDPDPKLSRPKEPTAIVYSNNQNLSCMVPSSGSALSNKRNHVSCPHAVYTTVRETDIKQVDS